MNRRLPLLAGAFALSLPLAGLRADPPFTIPPSPAPAPALVSPAAPAGPSACGSATPAAAPAVNVAVYQCKPPDAPGSDPAEAGWMGGAALYYLKPYLQNNTAYVTTIAPGTPTSVVTQSSFPWQYEPAAAFWLGYSLPGGLGVRARYFYFDQTSSSIDLTNTTTPAPATQTTINPPLANFLPLSTGGTAFGSPGTVLNSGIGTDVLSFSSNLRIHAFDVEATYAWQGDGWTLLASAGGRYLTLDQDYNASLTNNGAGKGVNEVQLLEATRNFRGGGPVASLLGQVYFGRTGLSLVGSVRGSFLVGGNDEHVNFTQIVNDPNGVIPPGIPRNAAADAPGGSELRPRVTVAELELGLQYDVSMGGVNVFVRASVVSQTYFDAGNASQGMGNLALFGVQGAAGINY